MARSPANAVKEETFEGMGGFKIFLRSWKPASKPRGVIVICHGVNSHGGQYIGVVNNLRQWLCHLRVGPARPRKVGRRTFLRQSHLGICQRRFEHHKTGKGARSGPAGFPARPQRRRCGVLLLCARLPGRDHRAYLREFCLQGARPRFRSRHHQGPEPHRPESARPHTQEQGVHPRSRGTAGLEQRPAHRQRSSAGANRGGIGPRRQTFEEGISAYLPARIHSPRHRRQGHSAKRQPILL